MNKQFLETGKIVGLHGIKGELKLEPWSDSPEFLMDLETLYAGEKHKECAILNARVHKSNLLIELEGIDNIDKAKALIGTVMYLNRDDVVLQDGRYFISDLIGLTVRDGTSGKLYGKITEIFSTGANPVYEIKNDAGKTFLFPAVNEMIQKTDLVTGVVDVLPIKGIFDIEEQENAN